LRTFATNLKPTQSDGQLADESSFLHGVQDYLERKQTTKLTEELVESGKELTTAFVSLQRLDPSVADQYAERLLSCQRRTENMLNQLKTSIDVNRWLFSLHDQILALFLAVYSAYECFHKTILERILYAYFRKHNLVSEHFMLPEPFQELARPMSIEEALGTETKTVHSCYEFPVILRFLLTSSEPMTELYRIATKLSTIEESKQRAAAFADNLIHSTVIRNRIAHMSERASYYSAEEPTVRRNLQELAALLPLVLETLVDLFLFFSKLLEEAGLQIGTRKRPGKVGLLECIYGRLGKGDLREVDDVRRLVALAISKLRDRPETPNEQLFVS